jgi:hypothetical protein
MVKFSQIAQLDVGKKKAGGEATCIHILEAFSLALGT